MLGQEILNQLELLLQRTMLQMRLFRKCKILKSRPRAFLWMRLSKFSAIGKPINLTKAEAY